MAAFDPISSGYPRMDAILDHIRLGDNVVWQISELEEFRMFAEPFARQAVEDGQKAFGLPVTGVVNNATWFRIYDEYVGIATTSLANANLPISPSEIENQFQAGQFPGYPLSYGSND